MDLWLAPRRESGHPLLIAPAAQQNKLLVTAKLWKCTADSVLRTISGLLSAARYREASLQTDRVLETLMRLGPAWRPCRSEHGRDPQHHLKRSRNRQLAQDDRCHSGLREFFGVRWIPPRAVLALNDDIGGYQNSGYSLVPSSFCWLQRYLDGCC